MSAVIRFSAHSISLFLLGTFLVPVAQAATGETLFDDLNAWQETIDHIDIENTQQNIDVQFQGSKELFPDLSNLSIKPTSVLDEKRKERTEAFVTIQAMGAPITLSDVPRDAWFAPYIRAIADRGLVTGYKDEAGIPTGKFGPGDNVTIEQMAKVVVSAAGISPSDCSGTLLNLSASGSWSAPFALCAENKGWNVYADGSVDVHRPATRVEVVATLLQAYNVSPSTGTGTIFTDVTPTAQYASMIAKAKEDGIISGYTDTNGEPTGLFGPQDPVTRAEFAKIITLGLQVYGKTY